MTGIFPTHCHVYNRSGLVAVLIRNIQVFHQFIVSGRDLYAVHFRSHAISADLLYIRYTGSVDLFPVCPLQALADGVGRCALCKSRILQQFFIPYGRMVNPVHFKDTFCHGSGFVKNNILGLGEDFQIVGTFHQHALLACTSDSRKETQRNTDYKRTRAADNEECQCPVNPDTPVRRQSHKKHTDNRGKERQRQCRIADGRRIYFCKFRDKIL